MHHEMAKAQGLPTPALDLSGAAGKNPGRGNQAGRPVSRAKAVDTTGDGVFDTFMVDTTGDGKFDTQQHAKGMDTTGDGIMDTIMVDTTGDGKFDTVNQDTTGDGNYDSSMGISQWYKQFKKKQVRGARTRAVYAHTHPHTHTHTTTNTQTSTANAHRQDVSCFRCVR